MTILNFREFCKRIDFIQAVIDYEDGEKRVAMLNLTTKIYFLKKDVFSAFGFDYDEEAPADFCDPVTLTDAALDARWTVYDVAKNAFDDLKGELARAIEKCNRLYVNL